MTLAAQRTGNGTVYGAVYSGVPVYEMNCRQVSVMRRRGDSFMNATQILKVAGVDKGRRTKILEREIQVGEHEKVQGGYGKYQGTWIPFDRSYELAKQYGVDELLRPLFEHVGGNDDDLDTPKKPRPGVPNTGSGPRPRVPSKPSSGVMSRKRNYQESLSGPAQAASQSYAQQTYSQQQQQNSENYPHFQMQSGMSVMGAQACRPLSTNAERYRAILMSIFLNHDSHKLPDLLTNPTTPPDLEIDLIIDDQGHSSLHWAAALARINVLQLLLNHGADPRRVNFNGESALIRAVLVTNNFDQDTFYDLLVLLHNAIDICDKKGRSVVHHIALTAGIKGRIQASRYYLDTLVDMMRKNGLDIRAIIDLQDKNGDTALNIAARIGNRNLVEQLLTSGASSHIANRAGLRPLDFGLEDMKLAFLFQEKAAETVDTGMVADPNDVPAFATDQSIPFSGRNFVASGRELGSGFESAVSQLEGAVAEKESQIRDSLNQINIISKELAESRKVIHNLATRLAQYEQNQDLFQAQPETAPTRQSSEEDLKLQNARLKVLLQAHGISLEEIDSPLAHDVSLPTAQSQESRGSHVNQLLAQVLNVPLTVSETLVEPILAAVDRDTMNLDEQQMVQLMEQADTQSTMAD